MGNFEAMKDTLRNGIALSLIPQIILVKWLGSYPQMVESYFSEGLYPYIAGFFRILLGWIPFSIGDIVYALLLFLTAKYLFQKRKHIVRKPKIFIRNVAMILAVAYFTFHMVWGLNYYRTPISQKLNIGDTHSNEELIDFVHQLIDKTNELQYQITSDTAKAVVVPYTKKEIFEKCVDGYTHLKKSYPFLAYSTPSIKKSLFSVPLSYMGYGGYLNPFTHEAQVNGLLPNFRFPVVSGHEMGHQIGYSAENETNFIGYLVTANNPDVYFQYAASAYALGYCLSDIKRRDTKTFESLVKKLNQGILLNFQEVNNFWASYENPLEPVFKSIFNSFLKANNQEEGIKSYSKVVTLLVTYYKKNPL